MMADFFGVGPDGAGGPRDQPPAPCHHHRLTRVCYECLQNNAPRASENTKATNPKDAEARQDSRVSLSLFPDTAVVAGALAFTEGDAKYGGHNYRVAGVRASVYFDAEERHMKAWRNGEDVDPDSGLPHLWKALACIAVLIDAQECGKLTDDRPPAAPIGDMLARLKADVKRLYEKHADRKTRRYTAKA